MIPSRYVIPGQTSVGRKARLEGKSSLLPKLRQTGSTDRMSSDARRPSASGHRSSSAEPHKTTLGVRLSRDTSVSKQSMNARPRSQQSESRYGQAMSTPKGSGQYCRLTVTPLKTPEDRSTRNWETSLDRALAFVTVKDQRPLSNAAWQRAQCARVSEALAARVEGGAGALIRPLTIARFLDIVTALLAAVQMNPKLNNDNYVTKLPHLCRRLLYPGAVSKSWLRTVNTLHAFPHALALIAYILDLVDHIEMPVLNEWLYVAKDDLSCLRRDFLNNCWLRFQSPEHVFENMNEEYLRKLKVLLGNDEEKVAELQQAIKNYEYVLEDETELAERADEARRVERRDALAAALRAERAARLESRSRAEAGRAARVQHDDALRHLHLEIERATAEIEVLREEVARQPLSVTERSKLLEEHNYTLCVLDSKLALLEQISQMVQGKEAELAQAQKKILYACVKYKQGLIHLAGTYPELSAYAVDEDELLSASCTEKITECVRALHERSGAVAGERARRAAGRAAAERDLLRRKEETGELELLIEREQAALECEEEEGGREAARGAREEGDIHRRVEEVTRAAQQHQALAGELGLRREQDAAWRNKLSELREYVGAKREEAATVLRNGRERRARLLLESVRSWSGRL